MGAEEDFGDAWEESEDVGVGDEDGGDARGGEGLSRSSTREAVDERGQRGAKANERATNEGAVSATITVNFRFRAAALRKASTVLDWPMVRMNSLRREKGQLVRRRQLHRTHPE